VAYIDRWLIMQADFLHNENKRLQRCISDLVSLMALPAMWAGRDPSQIAGSLLDAILSMINLDFAHLHLKNSEGGQPLDALRLSNWARRMGSQADFGTALGAWINAQAEGPPHQLTIGSSSLVVHRVRLGLLGEIGLLLVGSRRSGFPNETENLLLNVAANQATIGLQSAWQLSEQKRIGRDLDQRVEERTRELAEANDELRRRELDFQLVVDSIPVPVAVTTPSGEVEGVNRPTIEYFGKTFDELKDWKVKDLVHPDDLNHTVSAQVAAHESGETYNVQSRNRRFDGVYRWFNVIGVPLRDPQGAILRWFHLIIDIDDQKRAEEALAASERNLAEVVNTIPGLAWSAQTDGSADFFNQHYLDYVGITFDEARGFGWTRAVHPDDLPGLIATWRKMLTSYRAGEAEARLRRIDGEYRWFLFRTNALRDEDGQVIKWFGVNTDIEDRKRAEEALRTSEWKLRQLTETIPQMLWSATPDGSIDYCNARLLDYTGFTAREVMDNGWKKLLYPDDLDQAARTWITSVATGVPYQVEARLVHAADQTYRWCLTTALPLRDEDGQILKWHGACVDMHDWKQAQDELRETQAELAHASRVMTMGQLTASIAHELNQPLAGIMTNAGTGLRMLSAEPPNVDGARDTARRTIRDATRASEVIVRLRALFAKRDTTSEIVDLNSAVQEVVALSLSELERNGINTRLSLARNLPYVMGDRIQLQQVALNFILNAAESMVEVTDRAREIVVSTTLEATGHVRVAVKDTGGGVDTALAEKLFTPFYTTKRDGMGIGLSVSRTIVEQHQGRLWAEQNDGPGSTFCFSVPSTLATEPAKVTMHLPPRSAEVIGKV
jgi:PAS domain S-box-containing protein